MDLMKEKVCLAYRYPGSNLFQWIGRYTLASVTVSAMQVIHFPAFNSLIPELLFEIIFSN